MADTYFGNLRKVGASVDESLAKLQDTWSMPHVLLCSSSDETKNIAKQLLKNLKTEVKHLRDNIDESKRIIIPLEEAFTQELEERFQEVENLKKELDEIKVLFVENGYVEEPIENNVSDILNNQLESLSINNSSSFIKDGDLSSSFLSESNCLNDSEKRQSFNTKTPIKNSCGDIMKKTFPREPPMEPIYSPCYYKIIKK